MRLGIIIKIGLLTICLLANKVKAQDLKDVKSADYYKWGNLSTGGLSPDGSWTSYRMSYENGMDTLFLRATKHTQTVAFPSAKGGTFIGNSLFFICRIPGDSLCVYNLLTHQKKTYGAVKHFEYSEKGNYMVLMRLNGATTNLTVVDNTLTKINEIPDVLDFSISENGALAYYNKDKIIIADFRNSFRPETILNAPVRVIKKIIWSDNSNSLAFLARESSEGSITKSYLYYFNLKEKKLKKIGAGCEALTGKDITTEVQIPLILSADGQQVFFYTANFKMPEVAATIPEVWDSGTKLAYPAQQLYGDSGIKPKITVWYPKSGLVRVLATDNLPLATLTSDRKYVLIYSHLTNEPQYKMVSEVDYYLVEVATGKCTPFLTKQSTAPYTIGSSPKGRYIHYFRMGHWWVYDTGTGQHCNITLTLGISFTNADFDEPGSAEGYKCPGWVSNDKYIILYDRYDIWLISPDGKNHIKITDGRKTRTTYRICEHLYGNGKSQGAADFVKRNFDITKGIYLYAVGADKSSGYFFYEKPKGLTQINYGARKRSNLQIASDRNACVYTEENFETPPSLHFASPFEEPPVRLYQSNAHYSKYKWGQCELISYKNKEGDSLQGLLYYPSGYQKDKKYPMIVYIYSKLTQNLHEYYNPVEGHQIGFQPVNYINDGYVVLMPDIKYKVGSPGESIVDCVEAGVKYAIEKGVADGARVGLIGHSYGGYETCYLITQSKLFAAAVAGAAVTDVVSSYLSVNTETGDKMDWRFESQQYRLGTSLFDDIQKYLDHSTVLHAAKIITPLLSWTGKDDISVSSQQGIELHLALRRLGKKNIFLAYPGQGHILTDTQAKIDLSTRIKEWFDHFLKNSLTSK